MKALLTEYEACQTNRNHYDSVRWTIASIFIGFSLTTFGVSFLNGANTIVAVFLLASFSILLFLIAIAYYEHVDPWIETSQDRLWQIEDQLQDLGLVVRLHHMIDEESGRYEGRGTLITYILIAIVVMFWALRIVALLVTGN